MRRLTTVVVHLLQRAEKPCNLDFKAKTIRAKIKDSRPERFLIKLAPGL